MNTAVRNMKTNAWRKATKSSSTEIAIAATISIAAQGTDSAKAFYAAEQHAMPSDATPTDDAIEAADPTDATILDDSHRSAFARGTAYASFAGAAAMLVGFGVARRMRPLLPPGREVGGIQDAGNSPSIGADAASREDVEAVARHLDRTIYRLADTPARAEVLARVYPTLPKTSIDFGVMEPAGRDPSLAVCTLPMELSWLDVGS